ncbi:hypothetical protein TRL7639_01592 [Falsiruegeria litorea R37]|uniref:HEPN domain protein n=1 Tax=Falsiruegeria litorea R37 TaxID=1200284 RepID=A0A1Y5S865_9RHOB|nr:hypothetical protein [Falsiruegeria litorea]SLN34606.1 hypothetical protein TRL7639_01592 [Falsiruegeria litorea R37]
MKIERWRSFTLFARQYLNAVDILSASDFPHIHPDTFAVGPIYNSLGLAAELTFKAILLKELNYDLSKLRSLGHNLRALYVSCDAAFDRVKFEKDVFVWSGMNLKIPLSIKEFYEEVGLPEKTYFHFSVQLEALNFNYNRDQDTQEKFATRYLSSSLKARQVRVPIIRFGLNELLRPIEEKAKL